MQLSKLESKAYGTLKRNNLPIFKTKDLMLLLGVDRTKCYNIIKALKRKEAIQPIRAGLYAFQGVNEMAIGSYLNWPSYLSFWSALSYYGLTDNMPKTLFYAATRYRKRRQNYKYVTISKKRFFGYIKIGDIMIAEKEKAITDSLLFPKYAGGIREIAGCIEAAIKELDKDKLIDYALKTGSKAAIRRLGFILELFGYKSSKLKKIGKGYELLDPALKKRGNLNRKWLLDINYDITRRA